MRFSPTGGGWRKVYIIDEVHLLSSDAFAALLKTLEEPPAHLVFVFATTDPQKLPETIRSRCQRFDFRRPRSATSPALARIVESDTERSDDEHGGEPPIKIQEAALIEIARHSQGDFRDAIGTLERLIAYARNDPPGERARGASEYEHDLLFKVTDIFLEHPHGGGAPVRPATRQRGVDFPQSSATCCATYARSSSCSTSTRPTTRPRCAPRQTVELDEELVRAAPAGEPAPPADWWR